LLPAAVTLTGNADDRDKSPLLVQRTEQNGHATAYVCEHYACRQPVTSADDLGAQLDDVLAARQRAAT
jgi:uncharacterized protein YyaL (SSP411 family)